MFNLINVVNDFEVIGSPNDETQQILEFYRFGFYALLIICLLLIFYIMNTKHKTK